MPLAFLAALSAAFLWGAAGAVAQALLVRAAGLSTGFGLALPLGLAAWFAGFALGAALSGRLQGRARTLALAVGGALPVLGLHVAYAQGAHGASGPAAVLALAVVALVALPQGLWFAPLVRAHGRLGALWCADLLGAGLGLALGLDLLSQRLPLPQVALCVSACGLAAAWLTWCALRIPAAGDATSARAEPAGAGLRWLGAAACGAAAMTALEIVVARLCAVTLGGLQPAHNATLLAVQLALFAGALLLPLLLPKDERALAWLACVALLGMLLLEPVLRLLPAVQGATSLDLLPHALACAVPLLFAAGAFLPALARAAGEARTARWLAAEGLGALCAGPFVALVVVPQLQLGGALAFGACATAASALCAAPRARLAWTASAAALIVAAVCLLRPSPVLATPPYQNGAWELLSYAEDREYAVAVVDDGLEGERTVLTDSFRAAGTGPDYRYMQALGHLPLLLHPEPRDVAVLALGTGTTLGAATLHPRAQRIEVLELSRAVLEAAPYFGDKHHGTLDAPLAELLAGTGRVRANLGDGRATLARMAREGRACDVLTMEPLLPDAPGAVYLYTSEFYAIARGALRPGGILVQWVPTHALEPQACAGLLDTFAAAFPHAAAFVAGTQTILVGSDRPLRCVPAAFDGPPELRAALAELGLASPAAVQDACAGALAVEIGARLVRDADPWIVHAPRRSGAALLSDLPDNLLALRRRCAPLDLGGGAGAGARAAVRLARERFARETALLAAARAPAEPAQVDWRGALAEARALDADDAELRTFEAEAKWTLGLREGVSILLTRRGQESGREALQPLLDAAEARPQRADVHAWVAVALDRAGSGAASAAARKALELCPGLARTRLAERLKQAAPGPVLAAQFGLVGE